VPTARMIRLNTAPGLGY